ncbi:predicted protein [Plenodomus lingam JN3]|uniref:J domain-containing protein n=1 Tax=Leptosphaeria maculans (strain JN3 / isolate v23.1.3 / race Av1-4-5-6-7-8) TaxID=985895 RepID=M1ZIR4_LEPMJ|nr:predicted protein [Plenodomus lingam JN3]
MRSEPVKPARADFYLDLGLSKDATRTDIRKSFHALARLHHPDKKAPAQTVDAVEFRQVCAAFEVLGDEQEKANYDEDYEKIKAEWQNYRRKMRRWERWIERERRHKEAEDVAEKKDAEE